MDIFTEKANSILKTIKPIKEKADGAIVYSSEDEEAKYMQELEQKKKAKDAPAEDIPAEDAEQLTKDDMATGLDKQTLAAINLAQKMSAQAAKSGVLGFRTDPQKALNQAYGKLMTGLAAKLSKIKIQ